MKKFVFAFVLLLAALSFPIVTYAAIPATVRIGLTRQFGNRETIVVGNTSIGIGYINSGGGFSATSTLHSAGGFTVRVAGGQIVLYASGARVFTFSDGMGALIADASGGTVSLGGYSYRGVIEFRQAGGRLTAINIICPEEYLLGVLPMEMSYHFHIDALKAQAIASRTFMIYRKNDGHHSVRGFDLCDDTHCQSYRGSGREHANTTRAVNETQGLMMFFNNAPILAVYHSSSGGSTDNSENVWQQARPYLRGVRDVVPEHDPVEWTRTFSWAEITTALTNAGANIGTATGISITGTNTYGRVRELTVHGTSGQWRLTNEATRTFFAPIGGALMSRNFYIEGTGAPASTPAPAAQTVWVTDGSGFASGVLSSFMFKNAQGAAIVLPGHGIYVFDGTTRRRIDSSQAQAPPPQNQVATGGTGVTLIGRGWGHGLGMGQRGAHGMALAGFSYREILRHYYTGVEIR